MIFFTHFRRANLISKRLAPNLRHLSIDWDGLSALKSLTEFFERDLLISLTKFKLYAQIDSPHFLHNLLLVLSSQCSYSFDVNWYVKSTLPLPEISQILSDTCEQLKGLMSREVEVSVIDLDIISHTCHMRAVTIPRMNKYLFLDCFFHQRMVIGYERKSFLLSNKDILFFSEKINGLIRHVLQTFSYFNGMRSA